MGGMKKAEMFSHSCSLAVNLISTLFRIAFDIGQPFSALLAASSKAGASKPGTLPLT
jgi:hypothetical protein